MISFIQVGLTQAICTFPVIKYRLQSVPTVVLSAHRVYVFCRTLVIIIFSTSQGVPLVVAAGNGKQDACNYNPASSKEV